MAFDQPAPLEFAKQIEGAVHQPVAVAAPAIDFDDPVFVPGMLNASALRQAVQDALFQFGDVHVEIRACSRNPRRHQRAQTRALRPVRGQALRNAGRSADDDNLWHGTSEGGWCDDADVENEAVFVNAEASGDGDVLNSPCCHGPPESGPPR